MRISLIALFYVFLVNFLNKPYESENYRNASSLKEISAHVVFDLDWTVFASLDPDDLVEDASRVYEVQGKKYYLNPFVDDVIFRLKKKGIDIYFFSGGEKNRNLELLDSVKLKDGKSLLQLATDVFHKEDLSNVSSNLEDNFSKRYKKDLEKVGLALEDTILIDDNSDFALNEHQKKNMFWLGPTYTIDKTFDPSKLSQNYYAPSKEAFDLNYYKFLIIEEVILEALEFQKQTKISFRESIWRLSQKLSFKEERYNDFTTAFKKRAIRRIVAEHSNSSKECDAIMNFFFKAL